MKKVKKYSIKKVNRLLENFRQQIIDKNLEIWQNCLPSIKYFEDKKIEIGKGTSIDLDEI